MSDCVIDASLSVAWCLPDEQDDAMAWLDTVAQGGACVPAIWVFEINNLLLMAERRRRIGEADVRRARELLGRLPITIEPPPTAAIASETLQLARRYSLTFYDASYLESAIRNHGRLGSFDEPLRKAAEAAGVLTHLK
jgi:predicted nucleic acid-binding protein